MKESKVLMPELTSGAKTATLCTWLKEEGERVTADEALFEIETEKIVTQVEAGADGTVKKLLIDEGDEVGVNSPVAIIIED